MTIAGIRSFAETDKLEMERFNADFGYEDDEIAMYENFAY